jgi:hypothetical protein
MIDPSRRELLVKLGAWPLLWPLLRAGRASSAPVMPKRVLIFCTANGPIMAKGPARGTETNFTLHDWWAPLERHRADAFFITGCQQAGVPFGSHNEYGHQSGSTGALTARTTMGTNNATGPSLDAFIGQELQRAGVSTPKRSLLWGVSGGIGNWGPWYEGAGKPATVETNPYRALADVVPGLPTGGPRLDPKLLRRRLALDASYKDCVQLAGRLGPEGRRVLDAHCANVEAVGKSVQSSITNAQNTMSQADCRAPMMPMTRLPSTANFNSAENYDEMVKAYAHLTALAFACDVTRVVGFSFGGGAARFAIPSSYGVGSAAQVDSGDSGPQHHAWTHTYNNDQPKRDALRAFYRWYSTQIAHFIDVLKATRDANGASLFDSTMILWTSELGCQRDTPNDPPLEPHPNENIPVVVFGNSNGALRPGRLLAVSGPGEQTALTLHQVMVSLCHHAGLTGVNTFGNAGRGPLEWLKG